MYTAELKTLRTPDEIQATEARCRANLALMARIYRKPNRAAAPIVSAREGAYKLQGRAMPDAQPAVHGPLHTAIIAGDLAGVRQHLTPDTVNQVSLAGLSPLHLAVYGYSKISETASWVAARANGRKLPREAIVDLLIASGAKIDVWDHNQRLPSACCEAKRLPDSLVAAMDKLIQESSIRMSDHRSLNAFYSPLDVANDEQQGVHNDSVRK
jgi:hypothetical protein